MLLNLSQEIEDVLNHLMPASDELHQEIFAAVRYSLLGGGKRLRPILAITTAEMFGIPLEQVLIPACALEMIHTYSLIHDDLPCIDNDDFRRGKPSLHKAFKEATAVLAGDCLLTEAFNVLTNCKNLSAEKKLELISVLAKACGGNGLIAGQILDITNENQKIDLALLQEIHLKKTAVLIAVSIEFGAIIGDASLEEKKLLKQFGLDIGLAFQIMDDVLDVVASKEKHGRDTPSDLLNEKTTYVTLKGIEDSKKLAEEITNNAINSLKIISYDTSSLVALADSLIHRSF
ncbi:MAG TPA: polyprenyl synthetase family protein [Parachlamydiaceae bacterium]|nr:polyprenyl synthetase family protein [Parachlamydiaceae bacterium]